MLSKEVKNYLHRTYHCESTTELKLGHSKFDVIGFEPKSRTFYIVESKLGSSPTTIGHAFGQILAYQASITENGFELIREFMNRVHFTDAADAMYDIFGKQKAQVKFFVALTDDACRNYTLLKSLKETVPHVGIIRYSDRCETYIRDGRKKRDDSICESQAVTVPIEKKYGDRKEFFREVADELLSNRPNLKLWKDPETSHYVQFRFGSTHFHLEIHKEAKNSIRLAMDIEPPDKEITKKFFKFLKGKRLDWSSIPGVELEENRGSKWGAVSVRLEYQGLDHGLVMKAASVLEKLDGLLSPLVLEFEVSEA
jgi:hypothetical protein